MPQSLKVQPFRKSPDSKLFGLIILVSTSILHIFFASTNKPSCVVSLRHGAIHVDVQEVQVSWQGRGVEQDMAHGGRLFHQSGPGHVEVENVTNPGRS